MSGKGKAFDKPNVNISHKLAVRRVAQLQAKQTFKSAAVQPSELEVLKDIINLSDMTSEQQTDAHQALREALKKIERLKDPLSDLNPPSYCRPCNSNSGSHGTHHFLCKARKRQPCLLEQRCRDLLVSKLAEIWRAHHRAMVIP